MTWFHPRERVAANLGASENEKTRKTPHFARQAFPILACFFFFVAVAQRIDAQATDPVSPFSSAPPDSLAILTPLGCPWGIALDSQGRVVFSDALKRRVYRVDGQGVLRVIAGTGAPSDGEGEGLATQAAFRYPTSVAVGPEDAVYVSDTKNHRVWKISPDGSIHPVAGTGEEGFSGDGGPATAAKLDSPHGLAVDAAGNLYIADTGNQRIRRVRPDGIIETVAGGSKHGSRGDGGPATKARLTDPFDVSVEANGGWLIADRSDARIREVSPSGVISTLAGGGEDTAEGAVATDAALGTPVAVRPDRDGSVLFVDSLQKRLYRVRKGALSSVVDSTHPIDGLDAGDTGLTSPVGLAVKPDGDYLLADWSARRLFNVEADGSISVFAGNGDDPTYQPYQPGQRRRAFVPIAHPTRGIVAMKDGSLLFTDPLRNRILKLEPGVSVSEFPPSDDTDSDGEAATRANLYGPAGLAALPNGDLLFSEARSDRIGRLSPDGSLSVAAGTGAPGFHGDGGPGSQSRFWNPSGLFLSPSGMLLIADTLNHRIRALSSDGTVTTIAGPKPVEHGETKHPDDDPLNEPTAAIEDSDERIVIADARSGMIRRVQPDGSFLTLAGGGSEKPAPGLSATSIRLNEPVALAQGPEGVLAVADATLNVVLGVDPAGKVRFVVGSGDDAGDEDETDPAKVFLNQPSGLAYDATGNLCIATRDRVWKYDEKGELISVGNASLSGWQTFFGRRRRDETLADRLGGTFDRLSNPNRSLSLHWVQKPVADLVGKTSAVITWETDPESWCAVSYGENGKLDHQIASPSFATRQSLALTDLQPGHTYHVQVTASRSPYGFRDGLLALPIEVTTEGQRSPPDSAPDEAPPASDASAPPADSSASVEELLRSILAGDADPARLAAAVDALRSALGMR
jgi:sugar lactone lactonase YvrE